MMKVMDIIALALVLICGVSSKNEYINAIAYLFILMLAAANMIAR